MRKLNKVILMGAVFVAGMVAQYYTVPQHLTKLAVSNVRAQSGALTYYYPQVQNCGYRWNLLQRIYKDTGLWPEDCPDIQVNGVWKTAPRFSTSLTPTQLAALDLIFADPNPCNPPTPTGTKYQFIDIYENRGLLGQKFAIPANFWIWYGAGGSTVYIYFDRVLTQGEKNKVSTEFATFFQEF